ncbi:MAG: hypothetical protein NVSMB29_05300 [Candidatus Dormibacteria bacterium]
MGVLAKLRNRVLALRPGGGDDSEGDDIAASAAGRARRLRTPALPDPAQPPLRRGSWEEAALTNVAVTEVVKRQIRTVTRPWNK